MQSIEAYFDYAAATPLDDDVLQAMSPFFNESFYNPSAGYSGARKVREAIDDARLTVSSTLNVAPSQIVFTSGCTEANNLVITGILAQYPKAKILISAVEHDSVFETSAKQPHEVIPVDSNGLIAVQHMRELITPDVVLISVMLVNNELGVVQPLREIAQIVAEIRKGRGDKGLPLYLHTDAAQAPLVLSVSPSAMGVDFMSLNGAKIYGPKGSGCLVTPKAVAIQPLLYGGGQEKGMRSGTENVPAIIGFAKALASAQDRHKEFVRHMSTLSKQLEDGIRQLGGEIISSSVRRNGLISSCLFVGVDNEYLTYQLDSLGFSVASGSACHASSGTPSRVLAAMGIDDVLAKNVIRLSLGRYTTSVGIENLLKNIESLLA